MPFQAYPAKRYRQNGVIPQDRIINGPEEESAEWFDSPKKAVEAFEAAKAKAEKDAKAKAEKAHKSSE